MYLWPRELFIYKEILDSLRVKNLNFFKDVDLDFFSFSKIQILGIGKAAPHLVQELSERLLDWGLGAKLHPPVVFTKYGHALSSERAKTYESGHPICDKNSFLSGEKLKSCLAEMDEDDLLILCLTGGASAIAEVPIPIFSKNDVIQIYTDLLMNGASVGEMNMLRGELSQLKNGGLASLTYANTIVTFAISDVPTDNFSVIGSGPTSLSLYQIDDLAIAARKFLSPPLYEKFSDYLGSNARFNFNTAKKNLIAQKKIINLVLEDYNSLREKSLRFAPKYKWAEVYFYPRPFNCSIEEGVESHLEKIRELIYSSFAIFSGGELTFEVKGQGQGGRNTEFVLRMAQKIFEENVLKLDERFLSGLCIASVGTDGTDGVTSAAGAWINFELYLRAKSLHLDMQHFLNNNDSFHYFEQIQSLIYTGQTQTNIMDLRFISYDGSAGMPFL